MDMKRSADPLWLLAVLVCAGVLLAIGDALAATATATGRRVSPADGPLQAAIDAAAPGEVLRLAPGVYAGGVKIDRPLTLAGEPGAVIDGGGQGDVVRVTAPDVTLSGLGLRNSGRELGDMNSGVFLQKGADRARVEGCTIEAVAFGIWLDALDGAQILNNRITGDAALRSQDRGNGIHFFSTRHSLAAGNEVGEARDGIYIDTSDDNELRDNFLHDLRYGIHYMYANRNALLGNRTTRTRTGYALMSSKNLKVIGNRSERDENYGIALNALNSSEIRDNVVIDVQRGRANPSGARDAHLPAGASSGPGGAEGKALFVYNSLYNDIRGNVFAGAEIGIHLTAGSEDNRIHGNAFVANRTQVRYVAVKTQEWSVDGRGNWWSDYLGWDRNDDGLGDTPYEPVDGVDRLLWQYPAARVLLASPAVETLRWVQRQFPVLRPQGVRDSHPLMNPPAAAIPRVASAAPGAHEATR